ncbi:MAG: THUMP domain-containing class I SAM-dependent RNA methyltransferase [Bacillota bacterium]
MEFVATCAFGIEAVLKRELEALNIPVTSSSNGKIYFRGDMTTMMHANLSLRTAERVFMVLGKAKVTTYDALFDFVKGLELKPFMSEHGRYIVNAKTHKSTLFSPKDIQSITKKALIENLKLAYKTYDFLETGEPYMMLIDVLNDQAHALLDTSGHGLHKRGYRLDQGDAPLKETLAASLVLLSFYDDTRPLYDPFCGSGTILIEAAMIAKNIAPGLNRGFAFEKHKYHNQPAYKTLKREYLKAIRQDDIAPIYGRDIDLDVLKKAEENAYRAGVDDVIEFGLADVRIQSFDAPYGVIITNPPYGERLEDQASLEPLYRVIGEKFMALDTYSIYLLTAFNGVEGVFKKKADKTRVLFNGNIKARLYQYYGPRPPR